MRVDEPAAVVVDADVTAAVAGLLRVSEPPSAVLAAFVEREGPAAAWQAVVSRTAPRAVLEATAARMDGMTADQARRRVDADLAAAGAAGARLIMPGDPDWPTAALSGLEAAVSRRVRGSAPPLGLYVRGRVPPGLPRSAVTIVGSRASSPYGTRVAAEMAHHLVTRGLLIVSGAAFGIDTAAHRSALHAASCGVGSARCPTVAVLACGIDRAYPEANRELLDAIAEAGAVLSEYPPGTFPARHRFLVRNRLIAALGAGSVVVEAGRRSGTLSTAAAADQLGRVVMAVPGPVTSATSVGCHLLLSDRYAQLVTSADDVLDALGRSGRAASEVAQPALPGMDPHHPTDGLDPATARVFEALPFRGRRSVAELATESGEVGARVLAGLALLELHGLAEREGASWRRTPRPA